MKAKSVRILVGIALVAALFVGGAAAGSSETLSSWGADNAASLNNPVENIGALESIGAGCINAAPAQLSASVGCLSSDNNAVTSDSTGSIGCLRSNNNAVTSDLSAENSCRCLGSTLNCSH
ncbi:MAG TPA: hypothetical protein O0X39_06800 [Methanocorpusculum sp.]|nr:hypothetical protein [Methanocorpusculum sp.]